MRAAFAQFPNDVIIQFAMRKELFSLNGRASVYSCFSGMTSERTNKGSAEGGKKRDTCTWISVYVCVGIFWGINLAVFAYSGPSESFVNYLCDERVQTERNPLTETF